MATSEQIKDIFSEMEGRFDPDKVKDINAAIQFDLSGDGGGLYWLRIAPDGVQTGEGSVDSPKMTLKASADDFATMIGGGLNPMQAFMTGKIKIQGDTGLALKLMPMING
ncbi:MAG: SCP2 sterol-binding domain-containing protein [Anaerolineae bacterium]|nr:SCP2 sterol-binding domain-containing protein [Anaerolineae bacterium]